MNDDGCEMMMMDECEAMKIGINVRNSDDGCFWTMRNCDGGMQNDMIMANMWWMQNCDDDDDDEREMMTKRNYEKMVTKWWRIDRWQSNRNWWWWSDRN